MPKLSEIIESKYLKKEDVGAGKVAVVQRNVAMQGQPEDLKYCVVFEEFKKPLVLNSTNAHLLAEICGSDDTDDWCGQKVVLYNDPNIMYAGRRTGGIRVRARKQATPAPKPAPVREPGEDDVDLEPEFDEAV
jgi:hypothetical protein